MDWELYERYRATFLLAVLSVASLLLLLFQSTTPIEALRSLMLHTVLPSQRLVAQWGPGASEPSPIAPETTDVMAYGAADESIVPTNQMEGPAESVGESSAGDRRLIRWLQAENGRLSDLLDLKQRSWPNAVAARVVGRDSQRWFQEILLDRGAEAGLRVDDPVLAVHEDREGLIGRIIHVENGRSKAMLIFDPLSAVPSVVGDGVQQDGVVEGTNSHALLLKYLDRTAQTRLQVGDAVRTSGLGKGFPPGILIGHVMDMELDPRKLFLQARVRPSAATRRLHTVLVLVKNK